MTKFLAVSARIRYAADVNVNGEPCNELKDIPLFDVDIWNVLIDVDTGVIQDWPKGMCAVFHSKVCDEGKYALLNAERKEIKSYEGYVPDCLAIDDTGYGDYIIITVDKTGKIKDWKPSFDHFHGGKKL